jgi:hypothetical protein
VGDPLGDALVEAKVGVKLKLAALWAATMFCYIYGDFFRLMQPGKLTAMLAGRTPWRYWTIRTKTLAIPLKI